jgi:amino acid transporter
MAISLLVSRPPRAAAIAAPEAGLRRQLRLLPLVMVFFFTVAGGAYGLEPVVGQSGPGMALLLLLVTPLIWSMPAALMVAELSSAIPAEGGYYAWVKRGLGPFWGFLEGWWSWLSSFVDMAIYPVLFAKYLAALLTDHAGIGAFAGLKEDALAQWIVGLVVIWVFTLLNIRGVRLVGNVSILFSLLVLIPFGLMSWFGLSKVVQEGTAIWQPLAPPDTSLFGAFGAGLFVVMWNYQGWDSVSPVNGEVVRPQRNAPLAMWLAFPLVVLSYVLPTAAGLASGVDWTTWQEGSFPEIAAALGGPALGAILAIGGCVSAAALFNANLLSTSRLPFVLAEDGYLPKVLTRLHPRYATPWISIVVCSVIYSIFSLQSFSTLVVIDVITYAATLLLEFGALIAFRLKEPSMRRPYRVPGGWIGVAVVTLLPTAILALAIANQIADPDSGGQSSLVLSAGALATGVVLYPVFRLLFKRGQPDIPVPLGTAETPLRRPSAWLAGQVGDLVPTNTPGWRP